MPVQNYTPSYAAASPYRVTPVTGAFMGYYVHRQIAEQQDDVLVTMDNQIYVSRPDRLANDIYSDPDLWWVFGVRNGWQDPVYDLKMGVPFYIPAPHYIRSIL